MTHAEVDLRALERSTERSPARPRRRAWMSRYVLPGAILLAFVTLLVVAAREQLLPRRGVMVVPVVVTRAEVQRQGTPLFQAAGWVEPRPTPINVPALTEGVVEELLVVEGQEVAADEAVARLIAVDARLAVRQAEAVRELREAELQSADAEWKAARLRMDHPVHLEAELADAQSLLAKTETARGQVPFLVQAAEARMTYAQKNLDGKQASADAIAGRLIQQAESELAKARAELEELRQRAPRLEQEAVALRKKVTALATQLELRIEESRQLEDAEARRLAAKARLSAADLEVELAELALERTVVRAPTAGRVLRLIAHPGTRVMGLDAAASHSSSTVASLYDPRRLQVRADVRLEDVPLVQPGQRVEIETASSKQPIRGTVLLPTSSANIQKNTLEVKVAIENPPVAIRPEMLVTATFLAPAPSASESEDEPSETVERLMVPRQLVQSTADSASVWIVDTGGRAKRQPISLGKAGTKELVEVTEGIRATDKLISSDLRELKDNQPVRIEGEDERIGKLTMNP